MKTCKIIGLTGQSGAGKSTVAEVLSENEIPVISADKLVTELYRPNSPCIKTLAASFGKEILMPDGNLDRKTLARLAFSTKESTELLNSLIHPFVLSLFLEKAEDYICKEYKYVVFDAPQLFESRANIFCDCIISVVADEDVRIERICARDKISEQEARSRINAQLPEEFFVENSDLIIENNGSHSELKEKAAKLAATLN